MLKVEEFINQHKYEDWTSLLKQAPYFLKANEDADYILLKYDMVESDFTQDIVKECRGIIIDKHTLKAVALSFFKFFNIQEPLHDEIDWKSARVTEKIDGCVSEESLILTQYGIVSIKDIAKNPNRYKVLTYNHELHKAEFNKIDAISVEDNNGKDWYEIDTDIGKITLTGNHQVWCKNLGQYKRVDELDGSETLEIAEPNEYGYSKYKQKYVDLYENLFSNKDSILLDYNTGISINELHIKYGTPYDTLYQFLNVFCKEETRNISESKTEYVKNKTIETLKDKYNIENITNCSQIQAIKEKKKQTFIKHYGVDNIRKSPDYYNYVNEVCLKKYGKKRICDGVKVAKSRQQTYKNNPELFNQVRYKISNAVSNAVIHSISSLEKRIAKICEENNIVYKKQFKIEDYPKIFRYDFLFDHNILLEVNGDYWHANPNKYISTDTIYLKGVGKVNAQYIWERDKHKKEVAIKNNYKIIYIWENELKNKSDDEILKLLQERLDEINKY